MSAAGSDPRAYRMADADGKPLAVFVGGDGKVWLDVHGEVARLDPVEAMRLGGHLGGAGKRAPHRAARPAEDDRAPVDTRGPEPAYLVVADRIARRVKSGEFTGRRLPTGPELMDWYGVNRGIIASARRELIERGIITVTQGIGTFPA